MESIKNAEGKLEITIQPNTPAAVTQIYDYDFLIQQRVAIIKQANDYIEARTKELTEVDTLLAECSKLGIVSKIMPAPLE